MRVRDRIRGLVALVLLCSGCAQVDVVAVQAEAAITPDDARTPDARADAQTRDADAADDKPIRMDASAGDASDADAQAVPPPCAYGAPAGQTRPAYAVAIDELERAICSCDSITSSGALTTDAVDDARHGDVGVNGPLSLETTSTLDGSLIVAGSNGMHLGDGVEAVIGGDLLVSGPLEGTLATARIAADTGVAGRIDLASLFVNGTLTQPAGSERRVTGTSQLGAVRSQAVNVPSPCDCADTALFDTTAFVRLQAPLALPLPAQGADTARCAQYALQDGEVAGVLISLLESAAVYVPGDLHVTGDLVVDSEAGAEIDLFIAGDVRIDGRVRIGTGDGQGPVRIYVGGAGTVQLSSGVEVYGALYAPRAELVLSAPLTLRGALFIRRIAASAALAVHYDTSVR